MNLIVPQQAFLNAMRTLCTEHGAVLIFDEVMTGFWAAMRTRLFRDHTGPDDAR